jgi:hypothetical protein
MESVMLVVTLAALGLCGAMAALTARLLRDERRRSAARVAMLEAAAAAPGGPMSAGLTPRAAPVQIREAPADAARAHATAARLDRPPSETSMTSADLFGTTAAAPGGGLRFAGVAAIGMTIVALAIGALSWSGGSSPDDAAAVAVDAGPSTAPLELVALSHARTGDGLTVSGMVRNPDGGIARAHLTAVVFAFDRQGAFLTSTRSPIDPVNLNPGTQSLFTVNVPQAGGVSRYRVSFRTDLGVVPHVDRRAGASVERSRG